MYRRLGTLVLSPKFNQVILFDQIQWKLLNVITLGQTEIDNIIRMITISEYPSPIKYLTYSNLGLDKTGSI